MTAVVFVSLAQRVMVRRDLGLGLCCQMAADDRRVVLPVDELKGAVSELFRELSPFASRSSACAESSARGEEQLPRWESEIWRRHGNKLRLGRAGVMNLARE